MAPCLGCGFSRAHGGLAARALVGYPGSPSICGGAGSHHLSRLIRMAIFVLVDVVTKVCGIWMKNY